MDDLKGEIVLKLMIWEYTHLWIPPFFGFFFSGDRGTSSLIVDGIVQRLFDKSAKPTIGGLSNLLIR